MARNYQLIDYFFDRRFNPSFTGNAAMAPSSARRSANCLPVSILLLLEMPQWPQGRLFGSRESRVFQSFFYWKCRNGTTNLIMSNLKDLFQSFFYWKCRNGNTTGSVFARFFNVSILLLLEMPQWHLFNQIVSHNQKSFNPSFTGNAAMAKATDNETVEALKFQSFFYWKCRNGMR